MSFQNIMRDISPAQLQQVLDDSEQPGVTASVIQQGDGNLMVVLVFDDSAPSATESEQEALKPAASTQVGPVAPPMKATKFAQLASEYTQYFDACVITSQRVTEVNKRVDKMQASAARYKALADPLGIPWHFVAIIHSLESGCDFGTHLHNGDPLSARTIQVPKGRPVVGSPPFTWEASAKDALEIKGFVGQADWSIARMLYRWESNNGFGYRPRGIPSPYLWSFSNLYVKGRFVADHVFDPNSVSKQCGAGVLLKALTVRAVEHL